GTRPQQANWCLEGECQRYLSQSGGWGESGIAGCLFAAHGSLLHIDEQLLHGFRGHARDLYTWRPIHWCGFPVPTEPRRISRLFYGLGRNEREEGLGGEGAVSCMERGSCHGGGCRVLWNARRLV